jgi:ribose 5-phosphate isomerase B
MSKKLITEQDILEASKRGARFVSVETGTIITPSARDAAMRLRVEFVQSAASRSASDSSLPSVTMFEPADKRSPNSSTLIALGSDHGGFQMKEQLRAYLLDLGYRVADVGTNSDQACDYPDFAYAVALMVSTGQAMRGIMVDAVGVASAMVANKVAGVRAAPGFSELAARSSREHNDANVLTLGGRVLGIEAAKAIVKVWLETWFGGGRHQARVEKMTAIEQRMRPRAK